MRRAPSLVQGLVVSVLSACSALAIASLIHPHPTGLSELVAVSPVIVLAKASKKPARVRSYPIERARVGTAPYVRTSAAFEVVKVLRGAPELVRQTIYVDPPNWQLLRSMGEAYARDEPVPSPILPQYERKPKSPIADDAEQILFLRPSLDDAYEETMLEGRETKAAMQRVIDVIKAVK